jgi:hypothetical protein
MTAAAIEYCTIVTQIKDALQKQSLGMKPSEAKNNTYEILNSKNKNTEEIREIFKEIFRKFFDIIISRGKNSKRNWLVKIELIEHKENGERFFFMDPVKKRCRIHF